MIVGFRGLVRSVALPAALSLMACSSSNGSDDEGASGQGGAHAQGGSASASGGQSQRGGASSSGGAQAAAGSSSVGAGGSTVGAAGAGATSSAGGTSSSGGANGGAGHAGSSAGGSVNGGASNNGGSASGGSASGGSSGSTQGTVFEQARFHFGTIDSIAKSQGSKLISQLDFFTSGWMQGDTFDHQSVCDDTKQGGALYGLVPVQVAYISAAHVKRADKTMCDCNVTTSPCVASNDLCHHGAAAISAAFPDIIAAYKSYSSGFAQCYGTTKPIVFEMEPDWYQYTGSEESAPWTEKQAGQMLGELVAALKTSLPNARFSIDVSPWVGQNGADNGKEWYSNFDMSLFTFVNTSGGGTNANTTVIRTNNQMTWAGLSKVTGKPILADTGYGANGQSAGEDPLWNSATNINARIADGVISISQYNPSSTWGTTIASIRSQLNAPKANP